MVVIPSVEPDLVANFAGQKEEDQIAIRTPHKWTGLAERSKGGLQTVIFVASNRVS